MPDFTQNYNRYSYVLNNPLRYSDPSGEFIFSAIGGFVHGFFSTGTDRFGAGLKGAGRGVQNEINIIKGLFSTDENKSFLGRAWELISRFTWQLPQTIVGGVVGNVMNNFGQVNSVNSRYGVTAIDAGLDDGAFTIGNFILGPEGFRPDWRDHLFVHEYGHYIQSQRYGPFYLSFVGLPSVLDTWITPNTSHDNRWYEAEASLLGGNYFDRHEGSGRADYTVGSANHFDFSSFVTGVGANGFNGSPYTNPRFGLGRRNFGANNIVPSFHWTDIPFSFIGGGPFGILFSIFKHQ